ncbi:chromosome partition protein Smc-like [Gossypium hirsutum]|uniref:Chromosome partition protein Smc-like n=1 Tax=Gossypium hirsutum TaxID=3635 RepID=A0ABM2YMW3_GOSHI|nr:chromosome partition protein Smc-like [Gossypium hirsutum]
MREISEAWKKICCVKILTEGPTTTLEYKVWFSKRINDNIPRPSLGAARSIEENLRVVPSELEVIKQEFKRKSLELRKKIKKLEEEKIYLSLDVDVQKIEVEKVRKEKRKIEEDRDDLKTQYKRIQLSMKRAGLEKSSEQWQQKVQEERAKAEYWEKKFKEMQAQNQALEKENQGLKSKVTELRRSLHHHRSRNSTVELKASLNKIEEMKHNIGG